MPWVKREYHLWLVFSEVLSIPNCHPLLLYFVTPGLHFYPCKRYPSLQRGAWKSILSTLKHYHETEEHMIFKDTITVIMLLRIKSLGLLTPHNQKANTMVDEVPLLLTTPLGLLLEFEVSVHVFFLKLPTSMDMNYTCSCLSANWAPSKDKSNRMQMKKKLTLEIRKRQLQLIRRRNVKLRLFFFKLITAETQKPSKSLDSFTLWLLVENCA